MSDFYVQKSTPVRAFCFDGTIPPYFANNPRLSVSEDKKTLTIKPTDADMKYAAQLGIEKYEHEVTLGQYVVENEDTSFTEWPSESFHRLYTWVPTIGDYGLALKALKEGKKVTRESWQDKTKWLQLVFSIRDIPAGGVPESTPVYCLTLSLKEEKVKALPWIGLKTVDGFGTWQASQADQLAEDWYILD